MAEVSELQVAIAALAQIELTEEMDDAWEALGRPDGDSDLWEGFFDQFEQIRLPKILKSLEERYGKI